jgi:hypothetical protein
MKRNFCCIILITLLLALYFGNSYSQDTPPFGISPKLGEQQITKVPYSTMNLPDILASTAFADDAFTNQWCTITIPGGVFTNVAPAGNVFHGGEYANGIYYAVTYNSSGQSNLYTINVITGVPALVAPITGMTGYVPTTMAWKQPNGPMYIAGPNTSLTSSRLYTIDLQSGVCTLVAPITNANGLMFIAINCANDCYGIDIVNDNTVKINLNTGAGIILGPCGIGGSGGLGGHFELSTNILYCVSSSGLYTINTTTGAGLLVTPWTGHQPSAFGIPGSCGPQPSCDMQAGPFVSLPSAFSTGTAYPIKAKVTNVGTASQANIPVKFFVNGLQYGSTQTIPSLALGNFDTNTVFSWTPTSNGNTLLKICTALDCDSNRTNDTVSIDVKVGLITIFCDDFTNGSGNWNIVMNGGMCPWCVLIRETRPYQMPPAAVGNVLTADVDLHGPECTINSTATLINPLNCTSVNNVYVEFDNDFYVLGADQAILDVSTNGGTNWINKFTWTTSHRNTHEQIMLPEADGKTNVKIRITAIEPGWDWWWTVDNVCIKGILYTGITGNNNNIPAKYSLTQNYPNPFNPTTVITYALPKQCMVKLVVYDVLGREIQTLVNEYKPAGTYEVTFDGRAFSSGLYFYRMNAGGFTDVKKMMLVK